jgi:hypothetical protein
MESIKIVNARGLNLFFDSHKGPGLAILVGVVRRHGTQFREGLVIRVYVLPGDGMCQQILFPQPQLVD